MESVLIVDDDLALRGMLALAVKGFGYEVHEAASSRQAIEILGSKSVDVVLLDMGMPPNEHTAEEGLKVLNWASESTKSIKVIVLTGQDADATSYLAIKHGAFDFCPSRCRMSNCQTPSNEPCCFWRKRKNSKSRKAFKRLSWIWKWGLG